MIGMLTGKVAGFRNNKLLLDVHGVGYALSVTSRDIAKTKVGDKAVFQIHTYVKEDTLALFGFLTQEDMLIFKNLIKVSGVGPKLALTILSQHTAKEITVAISKADTSFFQSISGIGKKNAQKIIVDLKSKYGSINELNLSEIEKQTHQDLISALKTLGYQTSEINQLIKNIPPELTKTEEQLKFALKELHK